MCVVLVYVNRHAMVGVDDSFIFSIPALSTSLGG